MSLDELTVRLRSFPGVTKVAIRDDALWIDARDIDIEAMGHEMADIGLRLGTITALAETEHGETTVIYHFLAPSQVVNVKTRSRNGAMASLAAMHRPASWAEREIKDLFGVTFVGHPNLVPLLLPEGVPEGLFRRPMTRPAAAKA